MQNAINFLINIGADLMTVSEKGTMLQFHSSMVLIGPKSIEVSHLNDDDELQRYWVPFSKTVFNNELTDDDIPMFFHLNKVVSMDHCLVVTRVMKTA